MRGDNHPGTRSIDQIETVTDTWQLDISHGRRGHGSQLVDERARLVDGNEAVTGSVYHEKRWRCVMDAIYRRCRVKHLGVASLRALDDNALKEAHESCSLRGGAILPVVEAVQTDDCIDGGVGVSGQFGLPLCIVGGQSRQRCQVSASRRPSGDNEIGVSSEIGDVRACPCDRCLHVGHLTRPAMLRAGPVFE